jgi:hypothetical protein
MNECVATSQKKGTVGNLSSGIYILHLFLGFSVLISYISPLSHLFLWCAMQASLGSRSNPHPYRQSQQLSRHGRKLPVV